ncbi:MAG: crotonase/enoyl-CoA hydratase family protein [Iamia sp.]
MADSPTGGSPTYDLTDGVAVITLDDGKANAISADVLTGLHAALDRAESEARAVMITGRPGRFSAGFDLATMTGSAEGMRELVSSGARFMMRLYGFGLPTVAACTGHALAAGALTLLCCDSRIGARGDFKIGLNAVAIGMPLPVFAVELARHRLSLRYQTAAVLGAVYAPDKAVAAGYLDQLVPRAEVVDVAKELALQRSALRRGAVGRTKEALRGAMIAQVLATLDDDIGALSGPRTD